MQAKVTGIDASYYLVKDLERATTFYTQLLGMEPTMQYAGMASEWTFPGGETFGLYNPHEGGFHASGGVMFAVADVKDAVATNKARGVKFEGEGHLEETPGCTMAFGEDTEGNGFILHKRK